MDIFCQHCRKRVGQVADEKIPVGQKASVKCPVCGEKIILTREASAVSPDGPALYGGNTVPPAPAPEADFSERPAPGQVPPQAGVAAGAPNLGFSLGEIISEAWQKTKGVKGAVWGAGFMVVLVMIGLAIIGRMLATLVGSDGDDLAMRAALQITTSIAMYPFMAGVTMIGIRRSVELPVSWKTVFAYFSFLVPVVIASLLVSVLTMIGFLLLLPGIYLGIAYVMTIPLVVDKGMGPWEAMEVSRKTVHQCWFKVFGLYLLMALICLASMIPLGLGLIWTLPMFVMVGAILYRELFGVSEKA